MAHKRQGTDKLVAVNRAIAVHVKHLHEDVDLAITAFEELLESIAVQTVVV